MAGVVVNTVPEGRLEFVRGTLNPFLEHQFKDIAAYHEAKVKIRLIPTRAEFLEKFGRTPRLLDEAIAGCVPQTGH